MRRWIIPAWVWLACAFYLLLAAPSSAQVPGIKFGYSSSDQTSTEWGGPFPYDVEAVKHPTLGLLLSFSLGRWRVVPSVNYLVKGRAEGLVLSAYSGGSYGSVAIYDELEYLSVQNDVHLTFGLGNASFYLLAAPRFDVLLDQETLVYFDESYSGALPRPELPSYSSVVFGASLGVGQDIKLGRHTLILELRYDRDLTSAWDLQVYEPYSDEFWKAAAPVYNRTFMLQVGLRLWTSKAKPEEHKEGYWLPVNPP